jgi:hypothetical protein
VKLLAGIALFLLCALVGEGKSRRLAKRARTLEALCRLIRQIGERQQSALVSFEEGALRCPPSWEREQLLKLAAGETACMPLLTTEERMILAAYARSESRSVAMLRTERDALLTRLQRERDRTEEELIRKGRVYRSVGYLCGTAALLLVV